MLEQEVLGKGIPSDERVTLSEGSRKKMKFSRNRLPMQIRVLNLNMPILVVSAFLLHTPGARSFFFYT
jgi:hypothetical protein